LTTFEKLSNLSKEYDLDLTTFEKLSNLNKEYDLDLLDRLSILHLQI